MTFFKKELVSNTFLFLGYSFKDTLVLSCLSDINACLGESSNYHYTIMEDKKTPIFQRFIEDLEKRYHIRTLLVKSNRDIPEVLKKLNNKIKERKVFISGSFDVLPMDEDVFADQLCAELSHQLLENNYRICSGMGYKLGNYLSGHALKYLLRRNIVETEKLICLRPVPFYMSGPEKKSFRQSLIADCNVVIFPFGKSNGLNGSEGVLEEFEIAQSLNKYIIPIGITGYSSSQIAKKVIKKLGIKPQDVCFVGNGDNDEWVYQTGCKTLCINPDGADFANKEKWSGCIEHTDNFEDILSFILDSSIENEK